MTQIEKPNQLPYQDVCKKIRDQYDYGDVVPLDRIMELVGDPKPSDQDSASDFEQWQLRRMTHMSQISTIMLHDYKVCLSSIRGKGYMLIQPQNQADYALKTTVTYAMTGIKKGSEIMSNININLLSDVEKNHQQAAENQMNIMAGMMAKHIEKAEKIAKILSE